MIFLSRTHVTNEKKEIAYNIKLYYWGGYIIAILFISYSCKDFKIIIGE